MSKKIARNLILRSSGAAIRTATYNNQEYLVVPVVALVEGVIWPVNAKSPELVLSEEFSVAPEGWNGRPVFCGHPVRNGTQVSGNTPEILEEERVGWVFNSSIKDDRLVMEAWLDPVRCAEVGGDAAELLARVQAGDDIEISTGVLVLMENKIGVYGSKKFNGIWRNITPDHLALLPEGDTGACSNEMGCGVRAAQVHLVTAEGIMAIRTMRKIPQEERDKMPASDFAGKDRSFPIQIPGDVGDAADSVGRAGPDNYDTDTLKANIIRIAYRKGSDFVAQLPNDWKKTKDQKNNRGFSIRERLKKALATLQGTPQEEAAEEAAELVQWTTISTMLDQSATTIAEAKGIVAQLISDETENPTEGAAEEDAEETVENARLDALYALAGSSIDSLYKVLNLVSQCLMEDLDDSADYPRYAKGARNSKVDAKTIQAVHDNAVALGAYCDPSMKAASAADCGCKERMSMEKKDRIAALLANKHNPVKEQKALEAMTDEGIAGLEKFVKDAGEAETKAAAEKQTTDQKIADLQAASAKPKTEAEFLAVAPDSIKSIVTRFNAQQAARKTELVGKLKTAVEGIHTEADLNAMDVDQLEKLAKVAKIEVAAAASTVDFSGMGTPRAAAQAEDTVPAPPDLGAAIRAAAGQKKEGAAA